MMTMMTKKKRKMVRTIITTRAGLQVGIFPSLRKKRKKRTGMLTMLGVPPVKKQWPRKLARRTKKSEKKN